MTRTTSNACGLHPTRHLALTLLMERPSVKFVLSPLAVETETTTTVTRKMTMLKTTTLNLHLKPLPVALPNSTT